MKPLHPRFQDLDQRRAGRRHQIPMLLVHHGLLVSPRERNLHQSGRVAVQERLRGHEIRPFLDDPRRRLIQLCERLRRRGWLPDPGDRDVVVGKDLGLNRAGGNAADGGDPFVMNGCDQQDHSFFQVAVRDDGSGLERSSTTKNVPDLESRSRLAGYHPALENQFICSTMRYG